MIVANLWSPADRDTYSAKAPPRPPPAKSNCRPKRRHAESEGTSRKPPEQCSTQKPSLTTDVGLVLQTIELRYVVTVCVPTRPEQNDPDRARAWAAVRAQVGRRVLTLRIERGITQEELALSADIDRSLLIDVEKGRRSLLFERLYDLAQALGVPITEILRGNEEA